MRVILYSPDIPQNVGNIARTCSVTGSKLTLVRPLGFNLSEKQFKRAGMDYLNDVEIDVVDSLKEILNNDLPQKPSFYFFSTKGRAKYTEILFDHNAHLIFGSESAGLPQWVHEAWSSHFYTIPMRAGARSLNLSNSVAIVLYEACRQQNFKNFSIS